MQSIFTKYLPATNTKGARIKAQASGSKLSLTRPYDYEADAHGNHLLAAQALAKRLNWSGTWVEGSDRGGRGNVYVNVAGDTFTVEG